MTQIESDIIIILTFTGGLLVGLLCCHPWTDFSPSTRRLQEENKWLNQQITDLKEKLKSKDPF